MASGRFGSVSGASKPKTVEKWFKNATNDSKHKMVDKELQRIKSMAVVSVRKRHEDDAPTSPTSSRDSLISQNPGLLEKESSSDLSTSGDKFPTQELNNTTANTDYNEEKQQLTAPAPFTPEKEALKAIELEKDVGASTDHPSQRSTSFDQPQPLDDIPNITAGEDTATAENNHKIEANFVVDHLSDNNVDSNSVDNNSLKSAVSASQDLPQSFEKSSLNDDTASANGLSSEQTGSIKRQNTCEENVEEAPTAPQLAKQSYDCSLSSCEANDQSLKIEQAVDKTDCVVSEPAPLFQSAVSGSGDDESIQSATNQEELNSLRRQVKNLQLKCELQLIDLQERAACHSKLMNEKDALQRKVTEMNTTNVNNSDHQAGSSCELSSLAEDTASWPMSAATKNPNRISTCSNMSSASLLANSRSPSRTGTRRLNSRLQTPLPPQLPPPKEPLPPIPADHPLPKTNRHSGVQITVEHHEKVVQELLSKLQEQQTKSNTIIDSLSTKLNQAEAKALRLEQSIHQLQTTQRASAAPSLSRPSQPSQQRYSKQKKTSSRRFFLNLLTIFSKREKS
ncbi:unnamed protein product [Umbelopsis vinacea]